MILAVFAVLAVIGQALNVALSLAIDHLVSPAVGALTFVLLYMAVFMAAWVIALRIVEGRQSRKERAPRLVTHAG